MVWNIVEFNILQIFFGKVENIFGLLVFVSEKVIKWKELWIVEAVEMI